MSCFAVETLTTLCLLDPRLNGTFRSAVCSLRNHFNKKHSIVKVLGFSDEEVKITSEQDCFATDYAFAYVDRWKESPEPVQEGTPPPPEPVLATPPIAKPKR